MKATVEKIDLVGIDRRKAEDLMAELNKISNGSLAMYTDKYPELWHLYCILNGCFSSMVEGVHMKNKRV